MTRAAIYARYSSDNQKEASIEDQVRLCTERAEREGWTVANVYTDHAISGSSLMLRPGVQSLMQDAMSGKIDLVLSEALDRISRDQEDIAGVFKRLQFSDVEMFTLSEGEISELHIGLKGTMNALFLKDLAAKTHRGLRGRIEQGKSGGGIVYGYDAVKTLDANGELIRGDRQINIVEAKTVRRIFEWYVQGKSPKAMAAQLNKESVPGPSGKGWGASTIYGNWKRGTGILNNELYIGRLVWNKLKYMKDPDTGKRISRPNDESEWVIHELPELRIVDQELWGEVKARQEKFRKERPEFWQKQRPPKLFSHLIKCGCCGGGVSKISATHYGCSTSRNKGDALCDNRRTVKQDLLEEKVLGLIRKELMQPQLIKLFCEEYTQHINRLRMEINADIEAYRSELIKIEREEERIIQAVINGFSNDAMKERMNGFDARKAELRRLLDTTDEAPVLLHPNMAMRYRQEVNALVKALNDDDHRGKAAEIIRSLIDKIVVEPEADGDGVVITVHGDLPGILNMASDKKDDEHTEDQIKQIRLITGLKEPSGKGGGKRKPDDQLKSSGARTSVDRAAQTTSETKILSDINPQQGKAAVSPRNQLRHTSRF